MELTFCNLGPLSKFKNSNSGRLNTTARKPTLKRSLQKFDLFTKAQQRLVYLPNRRVFAVSADVNLKALNSRGKVFAEPLRDFVLQCLLLFS